MKTVVVCSIVPYERHWQRSYSHYRIKPGSPDKPTYMLVPEAQDKYMTDMEKGQFIMVPMPAAKIVADLIGKKELDQGFFVCEGVEATPEELETAIARQRAFYVRLVRQGDTAWAQFGKHEHISDAQRRAALSLGVQKDWATIAKPNVECPSCGELVPAHVAMCKHCSAVINKKAFDLLEFANERRDPLTRKGGAREKSYEDLSEGAETPEAPPPATEPVTEGKEA